MLHKYFLVTKRFVIRIYRGVMKHNTPGRASAISFFVFSAMIPMLLLMIYGASFLVPEPAVEHLLDNLLRSYVPDMPTEGTLVEQTVNRLGSVRSDMRLIGIIGLLWTTVGGFVLLQQVLDEIWEIHQRRSFLRQYLVGFVMLGILLGLTVGVSIFTAVSPLLMTLAIGALEIPWLALLHLVSTIVFPIVLFITCFFIYRVLPSHRPRLWPAVIGALFATGAIYVSRSLFMVYTHYLGNYQLVYGALTFVMLLTFWIYILAIILLLGAEVSVAIERTHAP
jgi:membrane protein